RSAVIQRLAGHHTGLRPGDFRHAGQADNQHHAAAGWADDGHLRRLDNAAEPCPRRIRAASKGLCKLAFYYSLHLASCDSHDLSLSVRTDSGLSRTKKSQSFGPALLQQTDSSL